MINKCIAWILILIVLVPALSVTADKAEAFAEPTESVQNTQDGEIVPGYRNYLDRYAEAIHPADDVLLSAADSQLENSRLETEYQGIRDVAVLEDKGRVRWKIPNIETGLYNLKIVYISARSEQRDFRFSLAVNGKSPFTEASSLLLRKQWISRETDSGFPVDSAGNEYAAPLKEQPVWQEALITDPDGLFSEPYLFYLESGRTLELDFSRGGVGIREISLVQYEEPLPYSEVKKTYNGLTQAKQSAGHIQAELPLYTTDSMLVPQTDRMSASTEPQDARHIKLNTLGGLSWQYGGQTAAWELTVPETGLYSICLRLRQNYQRGVTVARRFRIDGKVPFSELDAYKIPYNDKWTLETLSGEDPYMFYFEKGRSYVISMEAVVAFPDLIEGLRDVQFQINALYRKIVMVAGTQPDSMRDYELDMTIPNFKELVLSSGIRLRELLNMAYDYGFSKGGETVNIDQMIDMMAEFLENPNDVPSRLSVFKDNISALGNWASTLNQQPLELDYIAVTAPGQKEKPANSGFFKEIAHGFNVFMASFFADYNTVDGSGNDTEALTVWASLGRDQAQVIKQLIDNGFVPSFGGRSVKLSLVQQGLVQATLAGKGPDISIFTSPADTINLAVRGVLSDLSAFKQSANADGFDAVAKRYHELSLIPYQYDGKTYALPIEEQFNMMFYRTDIFEELNLVPPRTWEEMGDVISVLSRNNLDVGIPSETPSAMGRQSINETVFQTILYQNGGVYYRDGWKSTAFDTPEAIAAFRRWTDFYTKYSLPVEYDFFSRFRTGEMPLGIDVYTTYNLLSIGAPEIKGLWKMVKVPGTMKKNGDINAAVTGAGNGIIMFEKTHDKEAGWEFLQWFTGASVQSDYAWQIESLMGPSARFDTANIEAFKTLAWDDQTRGQLMEQWDEMVMIPHIPAGYYVARSLTNAFRKVVNSGGNPRETLSRYTRDMNMEIKRKRNSLGLD